MKIIKKLAFIALFFCSLAFAKEINFEYGFAFDLPEGFELADYTEDSKSFLFTHDITGAQFVIKIFDNTPNAKNALVSAMSKLGSAYDEVDLFKWEAANCAITKFSMFAEYSGWALAVPLAKQNATLVAMCYVRAETAENWQQFMMSCLNSLCVSAENKKSEGIITSYAFPKQKSMALTLEIAGEKIKTELNSADIAAAQFVVDCEWAVLQMYAQSSMWQQAWQRYYRAIFRDSVARTQKTAAAIYKKLMPKAKNDKIAFMQMLLSWCQSFEYERNISLTEADFTTAPSCLLGKGNDCDARAMLLCALAQNMGIDTIFFVSREYSHALFGMQVAKSVPGAKILVNDKTYLLGETTSHVDIGLIASELSDTSKWLAVPLD